MRGLLRIDFYTAIRQAIADAAARGEQVRPCPICGFHIAWCDKCGGYTCHGCGATFGSARADGHGH